MDGKTLLLLSDTVIFYPALAHLSAGDEPLGALGALMLTKAVAWQIEAGEEAWVTKSVAEWQRETGMTEAEINEARRYLRATSFWLERENDAMPGLAVRVNLEALASALEGLPETEEESA